MSSYFQNFPKTLYKFANSTESVLFQDLSSYSDIIDAIKGSSAVYTKYYILDNERPDQLSFKLYGTPDFYWTFFMMNDNIREQGWPLSSREVMIKAQTEYPETVLTTKTVLTDKMRPGQLVRGYNSAAQGYITHRHLDLGQLVLRDVTGTFQNGESCFSITNEGLETIANITASEEYLAAHHYEDADGLWQDFDPTVGPGALLTEVTYLDRLHTLNDALKEIRVIKRENIFEIAEYFNQALRS